MVSEPQVIDDPARQRVIEARPRSGDLGHPREWALQLGDHVLLLLPATGEWVHLDRIHDSWEPTGQRAGEVTFRVVDGHLGYRRHPA